MNSHAAQMDKIRLRYSPNRKTLSEGNNPQEMNFTIRILKQAIFRQIPVCFHKEYFLLSWRRRNIDPAGFNFMGVFASGLLRLFKSAFQCLGVLLSMTGTLFLRASGQTTATRDAACPVMAAPFTGGPENPRPPPGPSADDTPDKRETRSVQPRQRANHAGRSPVLKTVCRQPYLQANRNVGIAKCDFFHPNTAGIFQGGNTPRHGERGIAIVRKGNPHATPPHIPRAGMICRAAQQ
ncbi:hypothetical protein K2X14_05560 [Acetobacter sp. TBRC 12305]|uniref:Uncharacterized protein n=1 Tax=Acetobacter garciniae TaxID=2817435 RepID=A0A939HJJ8_9PROT|nr:hypothetical protein [Acetobacter garciniae]MBO1324617.1 hypothetical protein [Acetobacter garciniae]MBX0344306.1 hypothetical protein [Acetobacter garciniae]